MTHYYKVKDIDEELKCVCGDRYDVPKVLPCGDLICSSCEKTNSGSSRTNIICPTCGKSHI
jgi:hypothetical protein